MARITNRFMTNYGAQMDGNHAPQPAHSTQKTCYQGRMGVSATKTSQVAFNNSAENGLWPMASHFTPDYSPINNRAPTAPERGVAPYQATMGKYNNSFERND